MKTQMQIDMMGLNTPLSYYELYPEIEPKNYWEVYENDYKNAIYFSYLMTDLKHTIGYVEILKKLKELYELRRRGL